MRDLLPTYSAVKPRPGQKLEIGESEGKYWTKEEKIIYTRKICALYCTGKYTWAECCKALGVKQSRFRKWVAPSVDVEQLILDGHDLPKGFVMECREIYADARQKHDFNFKELVTDLSKKAIITRLEGFDTEEVTMEQELDMRVKLETGEANPNFGLLMTVKQKVKRARVAPDTSMAIFAATNMMPETFKNRNSINHSGNVDIGNNNLESLSDSALLQKKRELELRVAKLEDHKKSA